ncbi:ABC transporter permease [Chromohalobacter sp. TMW 2.2308]|uniref:ABC transporter permease n=1 Tax=Chromohalobacter moromii TaxID=2860329 RepID=A0A9X3AYL0_9GAMM|nr:MULTISPECIES: ABC transporter permease [Chromohalobacter]CDQ36209.1 Putative aliphatic sulfonates transport permease protein SsuC [Virgibacillus halodenitrificans]MCK2044034.1 ABC transporter permease [Chromohalobacter moromii]MCK2047074.1 ABC transporter permease [Chromohalobacter moromii]MCT8506651.1 ABC transporter permease [Chromohalobacter moromii]MCT8515841.1 ABC transporter permease [Chromohalobacter sp. TMW 2.2271]
MSVLKRLWPALVGIFSILGLWQVLVVVTGVPGYVLPSPLSVLHAFASHQQLLWHHAGITVIEIVAGLLIGCISGLGTALALARFHGLRRTLLPILLISQAVPLFALAPILMLWLGYGMTAKIVMATLIIYFPVASTCYDGLRQTPQGWLDLAQTLGADRRRRLLRIQLPAALPALASGMRMAASAAPIGAVIGEWVGSSQGLGYLMLNANARMQVDLMFAALLILVTFGVALYFTTDAVMRRLMPWHEDRTGATS